MNIAHKLLLRYRLPVARIGKVWYNQPGVSPQVRSLSAGSHWHEVNKNRTDPNYRNVFNRTLSTQLKAKTKVQNVKSTATLLNELKADAVAYRRIHLDKLHQILSRPEDISPSSYDFLLSCCGQLMLDQPVEAREQMLRSLWFMAGEPTLDRWKIMLQVYRENGMDLEGSVEEFMQKVKDLPVDEEFLELLLAVVCERGDVGKIQDVMNVFEERNIGLKAGQASSLIRGYAKAGNIKTIQVILDTLSAGNVALNEEVYGELMVGYLLNDQIDKAKKFLKEKGSILKERHVVEALQEAILRNINDMSKDLVKLLPEDVLNDVSIDPVLRNVCSKFIKLNNFEAVRTLLNELPIPEFNINESQDGYGVSLIFEMIKNSAPLEETLALVRFLIKTRRNERALHVACECAAKHNIDIYPPLLVNLRKQEDLRPHYFWPLIVQNFNRNGEAGVLDVLKLMQQTKTELDSETLTVFVLPKLSVSLKDTRLALKQLTDRGVKINTLMTPFVSHMLYQNRFKDVSQVVKLYPARLDTEALIWPLQLQATVNKSIEQFRRMAEVIKILTEKAQDPKHDLAGQLLMELVSNRKSQHDLNTLKALLQQLFVAEVRISRMSANVLRNHLAKLARGKDSELDRLVNSLVDEELAIASRELFDSIIVHPRNMTYDELECHLSELEEKRLNARGVLRRLLQVCVRENRLDRAVEVKKKCDEARVELSSGMLASVFDLHIKRKNLEEAGRTLEQIKSTFPGFSIDEHKIVDFAALMAENGFLTTAQNIIKQRASAGQVRSGNVNKNIWNLLTNTAQWAAANEPSSDKNHAYEMLNLLVGLGYCTYDNAVLGPVIREYLLKNQIKNAINMYRQITIEKRRTPLQLEIMTTLVRLTNSNNPEIPPDQAKALLSEIIQLGSKIHGPVNTNNTLIVALADGGTEAQLRRILINPETRVNHEYVLGQCEFLLNSGKLDVVLRLAKCSRGLANIRETDFLSLILKQYTRDNDCESAIALFNRLQAEDEELKISGDFARKLIDLLEVNNYEVPNGVRLYAK
ncbi:leucine-rich PPR motif-containing protein, mitochondrial [Uranotaenia lowii]|uniref:leucine-rich PPR motif-containing protein, mitochondrial n=1 Tax=Uranotaenia lowii TaxID=190385 RepID=UPI002478F25B|nr:leucine-rich PPR motif-containing protein, mitochondrial [Uranotaenia lowii]